MNTMEFRDELVGILKLISETTTNKTSDGQRVKAAIERLVQLHEADKKKKEESTG